MVTLNGDYYKYMVYDIYIIESQLGIFFIYLYLIYKSIKSLKKSCQKL